MNQHQLMQSVEETRKFLMEHTVQNLNGIPVWIGYSGVKSFDTSGIWRQAPPNQGHWFSHH